ncbi:HEAT repeat domain-containing protein, partial [Pseudomonas aeruginosa]|nr:HEAT repeat domain-containing protein [Pseudomonas aeruginosa]
MWLVNPQHAELEGVPCVASVADLPCGRALALYLFAHGLGSALLCVGVWLLLPRRYKFPLPWSPLFLFSLAFFVPLIGAVGVAAA